MGRMGRFAAAAVAWLCCVLAQDAGAQHVDRPDRAAAIREGRLTWYTSTPFPLVHRLADRFTQDTGIEVRLLRSGGEAVLRRFLDESRAGPPVADVLTLASAASAVSLARQGLLERFRADGMERVLAGAKDPDGLWIAQRIHLIGIPVRTDKVAEADRPRTWADLAAAKYKAAMVMPDPSFSAIQLAVVGTLSRKFGWSFYESLHGNETKIVPGHQQVYKTMQKGERSIGAEGADPRVFNGGKAVPDQELVYPLDGVFAVPAPTAVVRGARHPNAARLFAEFMLSAEAQRIVAAHAVHAARTDIAPPDGQVALDRMTLIAIDHDDVERRAADIRAGFDRIFK